MTDPGKTFDDALALAKADELSRTWVAQVAEASAALKKIGWKELSLLSEEDVNEIGRLIETASELIEIRQKLTAP